MSLTLFSCLTFVFLALADGVSGDYVRGCYFTNWSQYRPGAGKFTPEAYVPGLCTHIMYAFAKMGDDNSVQPFEWNDESTDWSKGQFQKVNDLKRTDPTLKTLLSIGGWNFGTAKFKAMSSSRSTRSVFIRSAIEFIRKHGFDGFDIDWEYPDASDKANFVALLREFREAKSDILLTAAVAAGDSKIRDGYDIPQIARYLDYIYLMSYDFHGGWESFTGHHSPLFGRRNERAEFKNWNTDAAARIWADGGMPKRKIVVGLAMYGRGWTLQNSANTGFDAPGSTAPATEFVREGGSASYYEICRMLQSGQRRWDPEQRVPYVISNGQWFGYDDAESIRGKASWIKESGYAGAFVWSLDFDDFSGSFCGNGKFPLLSVVKAELSGGGPAPGPGPTERPGRPTTIAPPRPITTKPPRPQPTDRPNPPSPTAAPTGDCSSDGFFRFPGSCTKYFRCAQGTRYDFECGPGTHFNLANNNCDWPASANCRL